MHIMGDFCLCCNACNILSNWVLMQKNVLFYTVLIHRPFRKQDTFVKHESSGNGRFSKRCDLDIWPWPWQMTLTLVLEKAFYPKEYIIEIWKPYHLPFNSYCQCKSFHGQTNGQAKNYMHPIYRCGGIKNRLLPLIKDWQQTLLFVPSACLLNEYIELRTKEKLISTNSSFNNFKMSSAESTRQMKRSAKRKIGELQNAVVKQK